MLVLHRAVVSYLQFVACHRNASLFIYFADIMFALIKLLDYLMSI